MSAPDYRILDEALDSVAAFGPDLKNGLTSHAPMVAEALCAMGRGDSVMRWLDGYRKGMLPWPAGRGRIDESSWRAALSDPARAGDWREFFASELKDASWPEVLDRWVARLAPGISAAATHGVIRVGHAARALSNEQTDVRIREMACALASWASTYQTLPTDMSAQPKSRPRRAINLVELVPPKQRKFGGTITSSLEALADFPPFAGTIATADLDGDIGATASELSDAFAQVYVANAHDVLTSIVFVHAVTSTAAIRSIAPHVSTEAAAIAMRYGWQAGCALYAAFGTKPAAADKIDPSREPADKLIDAAIANGDEHAIKFTEACLRENALQPSPAYFRATRHAIGILKF
jgi:hypothetical protein